MAFLYGIQRENKNIMRTIVELVVIYFLLLAVFGAYTSVFNIGLEFMDLVIVLFCVVMFSYIFTRVIGELKARIKARYLIAGMGVLLFIVALIIRKIKLKKVMLFFADALTPFYNSFVKRYNDYYSIDLYEYSYKPDNDETKLILFLIAMILSFVLLYVMRNKKKLFLTVVIMLLPLIIGGVVGKLPGLAFVLMILFFGLIFVAFYYDDGKVFPSFTLVNITVIFLVISIIAILFEPGAKEFRKDNRKQYEKMYDKIIEMQNVSYWVKLVKDITSNIVSGEKHISGDFTGLEEFNPDNKKDIKVTLDYKPTEALYIITYVGSEYTGNGWETIDESYFTDSYEELADANMYNELYERIENGQSELDKHNVEIEAINTAYNVGFVTYYASLEDDEELIYDAYVEGDGRDTYEYTFYDSVSVHKLSPLQFANDSSLWSLYGEYVTEKYLTVDEEYEYLSELCSTFTKGNDYKIETKINQLFSKDYKYDTKPGLCPKNQDFVEYFLNDGKKGFCVHFASASVLMYRTCGVPARYVEGYKVEPSQFFVNEDGTYSADVTDASGHAWCETFDVDRGWEIKEHTLGYRESDLNNEDPTRNEETTKPSVEETTTRGESGTESQNETTNTQTGTETETTTAHEETTTNKEGELSGGNGVGLGGSGGGNGTGIQWQIIGSAFMVCVYIMITLFLTLFIIVCQKNVRRMRRMRKYKTMKPNNAVMYIYGGIGDICKFAGVTSSKDDEKRFFEEMREKIGYIDIGEWDWIYDCARRAAFSQERISKEDSRKMYYYYKQIREKTVEELNYVKKIEFIYFRAL